MSFLIKGMEMPKNCKECMFADMDDVDFDYVLYCTANEKYADLDMYDHPMGWNCPLVEVNEPLFSAENARKFLKENPSKEGSET